MTKDEFKILFDTWFDSVRRYLLYRGTDMEQASDLAQDVFLRIWEKQILLNSVSDGKLIFKIAHDMFISKYRRSKLEMNYRNSLTGDRDNMTPQEQMQYNELFVNYTKALATMSEKHRTVFLMSKMDGLKYHEIANRLNLSVKAVEKRMSNTLAYLKKALQTE